MRIGHFGIAFFLVLNSFWALAQDFSNKGKEFWLSYSYHVGMIRGGAGTPPTMTLYITSDEATTYKVEIYGGTVIGSGTISPGQVINVTIPNLYFIDNEGLFTNKAIRVTADKPVVVYSYITRSSVSGATLCLPVNVLGKEYYSANFTQISNEPNSNSYFNIIAIEDNTTVEITPSAKTKNGWLAGSTYSVNLNKGDIYQVLGEEDSRNLTGVDLTNSKIKSIASGTDGCKPIAVFSGSGKVRIGSGDCAFSSDNLYQQLYPTATWGKKYLTVPSKNNPYNYYRIIREDATAQVYVNGNLIPATSFVNGYYQFFNNIPNSIESDKPISLAQYFTTQGCDGNSGQPGDPDMIMLNSVEQNIDKVTLVNSNLFAAATSQYPHQHHIHVIIKNSGTGISSFRLDGVKIPDSSWKVHPADHNYSYAYLSNVSQGYHRLSSDSGFNALAYGYANAESYGYSAGANVKDLYQFVSIQNRFAIVDFPATCNKSPFYFSMTFPYKPTQIKWEFNGLFRDTTINAPVYDSTYFLNGRQLYEYKLAKPYSLFTIGVYPIKVLAQNPTTEGCSGLQEINYDLQVFERPVANFSFTSTGCTADTVKFTGLANLFGRSAITWTWNFGDGDVSSISDPEHLYKTGGNFNVKFSAISDIGCVSDTATKVVGLSLAPEASFSFSTPNCVTKNIAFTDASLSSAGSSIAKWTWDFGDGNKEIKTSGTTFNHVYAIANTYNASLEVESDKGCRSKPVNKQLTVHEIPLTGFKIPDNCLTDPFSQFIDSSSIADGTAAQFTYLWNFGDANANSSNPNTSNLQNPKHKYTATGSYNASLTVTSNNGCATSLTQPIFINGSQPKSLFELSAVQQCSNKIVALTNNSSVDIGKIIKLEIQWDENDANTKETYIHPTAGTLYKHNYNTFYTPATKNYVIKITAYSGENCLDVSSQSIAINAIPQVQFDPIAPVCVDAPAFQITQASVLNNLPGTFLFAGKGVSSTGNFNPQAAGSGTHSIRYTYITDMGCTDYKDQEMKVFPLPSISAGPDRFVLDGGSTLLLATATGHNLSYVWAPAQSLNDASLLQPLTSTQKDVTYSLKATSEEGCSASDEVLVKVLKMPLVPNVFSPNGDGIHDRWEIKYLESYPGAVVEIYNRYGQLLFKSVGYAQPWDGTVKGNPLPAGTYYYIINPGNNREQIAGFVDIIR